MDWRTKFIDKQGLTTFVIDGYVENFSEGMAVLIVRPEKPDPRAGDQRRLYGYIQHSGKVAIVPRFAWAKAFQEGLAAVMTTVQGKGEMWGYIDKTAKFVIEPKFNDANPFQKGRAQVHLGGALRICTDGISYWEGGEWQVIDRLGTVLQRDTRQLFMGPSSSP